MVEEFIEFGDFDKVDSFPDPAVPIHVLVGVELDTSSLHTNDGVGKKILPRKNIEIERVGGVLGIGGREDESNADLNNVEASGHT